MFLIFIVLSLLFLFFFVVLLFFFFFFFFQAEDGIRDGTVTGVQTCALPISSRSRIASPRSRRRARCPSRYSGGIRSSAWHRGHRRRTRRWVPRPWYS